METIFATEHMPSVGANLTGESEKQVEELSAELKWPEEAGRKAHRVRFAGSDCALYVRDMGKLVQTGYFSPRVLFHVSPSSKIKPARFFSVFWTFFIVQTAACLLWLDSASRYIMLPFHEYLVTKLLSPARLPWYCWLCSFIFFGAVPLYAAFTVW